MPVDPFQRQQQLKDAPLDMAATPSPYERLGFRENPFPSDPIFNPTSQDPRRNGLIYDPTFRESEERDFLKKFVSPFSGDPPFTIGFVRVDPQAGGRGNGKSAFLHRIMQRVNNQDWNEWAPDANSPSLVALSVHVLPSPGTDRRLFHLIRRVFFSMEEQGLFQEIDANMRAAALLEIATPETLNQLRAMAPEDRRACFGSSETFFKFVESHGCSRKDVVDYARQRIAHFRPDANDFIDEYLTNGASLAEAWHSRRQNGTVSSDYRWSRHGLEWLVNGLTPIALAAGYRRLILLVDEFEKIFLYQTARQRDEFLDVLRQMLFEHPSAATKFHFLATVLTFHPSLDDTLREQWARSGLSQVAPLEPHRLSERSVVLGASTKSRLESLVVTYMDYFRLDPSARGSLNPFTTDALEPVFVAARNYPRNTLVYANAILRHALDGNASPPFDKKFVAQFIQSNPRLGKETEDQELPSTETDLRK